MNMVGYVGRGDEPSLWDSIRLALQRRRLAAEKARREQEERQQQEAQLRQQQQAARPAPVSTVICPSCGNGMRDIGWEEISIPAGTTGSLGAVVLGGLFFGPFGAFAGGTLFREPVYERRLRVHCACPVCGFRVTYIR